MRTTSFAAVAWLTVALVAPPSVLAAPSGIDPGQLQLVPESLESVRNPATVQAQGWPLFLLGAADGGEAVEGDCGCPIYLCVCGATCDPVGSPPWSCECVASDPLDSCFYRSCYLEIPPNC